MLRYEGVFEAMNAVVVYSNTGQSLAIAQYLQKRTGYLLFTVSEAPQGEYEKLILVFPIHCQSPPKPVTDFLKNANFKWLLPIATYGKMSFGNVLYELQKQHSNIFAAAYIPTKHAYLEKDVPFSAYDKLEPLIQKAIAPVTDTVCLPPLRKSHWAAFFPQWRSRIGMQIKRTDRCTSCFECARLCPQAAIRKGRITRHCIRCLKCVRLCPESAIVYRARLPLRLYLQKKPIAKTILYLS